MDTIEKALQEKRHALSEHESKELLRAYGIPVTREKEAVDHMMQEINARKILEAVRGMPPADLDQLSEILITVGSIGLERENIKEIDINPIILSGSQPIAVDALVVLSPNTQK